MKLWKNNNIWLRKSIMELKWMHCMAESHNVTFIDLKLEFRWSWNKWKICFSTQFGGRETDLHSECSKKPHFEILFGFWSVDCKIVELRDKIKYKLRLLLANMWWSRKLNALHLKRAHANIQNTRKLRTHVKMSSGKTLHPKCSGQHLCVCLWMRTT